MSTMTYNMADAPQQRCLPLNKSCVCEIEAVKVLCKEERSYPYCDTKTHLHRHAAMI